MQLSENFNSISDKMHCPCCNAFQYSEVFIKRVQVLRYLLDVPFVLDRKGGGFFRCRIYNDQIGGAKDSRHLYGDAMDLSHLGWSGSDRHFFVEQAINLGMSVGIYSNFFHIDLRSNPVLFYGS